MQRRALERIYTNLNSRLFSGHTFYSGSVLNLSEKGMLIWSRKRILVGNVVVVLISTENEPIMVLSRVSWIIEGYCNGMGAEIFNPQINYLRFVENLRCKDNLK